MDGCGASAATEYGFYHYMQMQPALSRPGAP
jgi:hypothetical protein